MKLEPTEAQRKAMIRYVDGYYEDPSSNASTASYVDGLIAAANSIPEGAPVGTVKQRPDGTFVAVRCGDVSPYPASWVYVRVMPGACEEPYGDDADSWPSYGEITPEPEGCGIGLDGECEGKCRKGDAPVGTIARRPGGAWLALRDRFGWQYFHLGYPGDEVDADSWPVIYDPREYEGTEYDPETGLHWFKPGEEPLVPRPDPTAQQEPPKGLYGKYRVERVDGKPIRACFVLEYLDDLHANKALLEYAFSVERVNPELAKDLRTEWGKWPGRSQREPALRERFPEQASAYVADPELAEVDDEPLPSGSLITPKPRELPSLDCEEARDGTEWKFRLNGEPRSLVYRNNGWRYGEVGDRIGGRCGVSDGHAFIREFAPYIEVVGDPS